MNWCNTCNIHYWTLLNLREYLELAAVMRKGSWENQWCNITVNDWNSNSRSYTTSSTHKHLKTKHSKSFNYSLRKYFDKNRSTATKPPKKK